MKYLILLLTLTTLSSAGERLGFGVIPIDRSKSTAIVELHPEAGRGKTKHLAHYKKSKELLQIGAAFAFKKMQEGCPNPQYHFGMEHDMGSRHEFEVRVAISSLDELPKPIYDALFGPVITRKEPIKPAPNKLPAKELGILEIEIKSRPNNNKDFRRKTLELQGEKLTAKDKDQTPLIETTHSFIAEHLKKEFKFNDEVSEDNTRIEITQKSKTGRIEFSFTFEKFDNLPLAIQRLFPSFIPAS